MSNHDSDIDVLQKLPISINGWYGDALQPSQWDNTLLKLENIYDKGHSGPIMVPTKFVASKGQIDILSRNFPNVWLWWAITGLHESSLFTFSDYQESYIYSSENLENTVCAIRPIVPGRNDSMEILLPILRMVNNGNKRLTYTGYRDPKLAGSKKYTNEDLYKQIRNFCDEHGIMAQQKCACMVAKITNTPCIVHNNGKPQNLEFIKRLGYEIERNGNSIKLLGFKQKRLLTKGDLAFIRILSKSQPKHGEINNSEILSLSLSETNTPLVCSSSWFAWARQAKCIIGCDYCFADYSSPVRVVLDDFGCNPIDIVTSLKKGEGEK
jgi:hypothetical protein